MQLLRLILFVAAFAAVAGQYLQERRWLGVIQGLPADKALEFYEAKRRRTERSLMILALVLTLAAVATVVYLSFFE